MSDQERAVKFCKRILPKVSRSFALTIPMLDDELHLPVLIAYLQDRLLDNFEDEISDDDISLSERRQMMDCVVKLFNPGYSGVDDYNIKELVEKIKNYRGLMPEKSLQKLTANAALIRRAYDTLEEKIKEISYKWIREMNQGMQKYLVQGVESFADLDQYCYYVAGTVGGFLTDTVIYKGDSDEKSRNILLENYNASGLFLQKINIIRDIKKDLESRDKHFWPLKSLEITAEELLDKANRERA
ncbi:MAG: squalene/phytoene synthase family protein, partial [Halanaerobiales bacterium]